eukprot:CFRG7146T1
MTNLKLHTNYDNLSRSTPKFHRHHAKKVYKILSVNETSRWRKWWRRFLISGLVFFMFMATVLSGHVYVIMLVILAEGICFKEIIDISFRASTVMRHRDGTNKPTTAHSAAHLPLYGSMNWYFWFCANYYAFGLPQTVWVLQQFQESDRILSNVFAHHAFISYGLYTLGIVGFVRSLKYGYYRFQFAQFGWCHTLLFLLVTLAYMIVSNVYEGLIWFLLPTCVVGTMHTSQHAASFILSKTSALINTYFGEWGVRRVHIRLDYAEFFISCIITIWVSVAMTTLLSPFDYVRCPVIQLNWQPEVGVMTCQEIVYRGNLWKYIQDWSGVGVSLSAMQWHALVISLVGSVIARYGERFSLHFKKAFSLVEDVPGFIPGVGSLLDRMESQLILAAFVCVYYTTFVTISESPRAIVFSHIVLLAI